MPTRTNTMSQTTDQPAAPPAGLLVLDKPLDWTSHDCVAKLRRLLGVKKIGHAGTLDPAATGVLVAGVGRGTRFLTYLGGLDKAYTATIRLGVSTTTDDAAGQVTSVAPAAALAPDQVEAQVGLLTGDILQVPSSVSAIKVAGKRAYARVRAGETVELAARPVRVSRFTVAALRPDPDAGWLDVDVEVEVSAGTYVRALARDLGAQLGVGGHLVALRRTRVGPFTLADAVTLAQVESGAQPVPLAEAAARLFPVRHLSAEEARTLGHGGRIGSAAARADELPVAAIGPDGELVAMIRSDEQGARPVAVFI
jgi:tRNA pseudouridine55 synthase